MSDMKLVILTQYFPPEVGAPQNRLYELAVRLQQKGMTVSVLTAMPNYPQMVVHPGYRGKFHVGERMDGMEVHRAWIYVSKSKGVVSRLLNYFSFVLSSLFVGLVHLRKQDLLLVESPPLLSFLECVSANHFTATLFLKNPAGSVPAPLERCGESRASWKRHFSDAYRRRPLSSG